MTQQLENEGVSFVLKEIDHADGKWNATELLLHPYEGFIFKTNWVTLPQGRSDVFKFDYEVLENPNMIENNDALTQTIGDILVEIITGGSLFTEAEKKNAKL